MIDIASRKKKLPSWYFLVLLGITLAAFGLRMIRLDRVALSDIEAANALDVVKFIQDQSLTSNAQPIYINVTAQLFWLSDTSNFIARFLPAVTGSLLCFLPAFLQKKFGSRFTIILAIILAVDPGMVALSRQADSSILAITFLTAAVLCVWKKKSIAAGSFFGFALLSGARFWLLISGLIFSWGLSKLIRDRQTGPQAVAGESTADGPEHGKTGLFRLGVACVVTAVVVGTSFFTRVGQMSGIAGGFLEYLSGWRSQAVSEPISASSFGVTFASSSAFVIVTALFGFVKGALKRDRLWIYLGILTTTMFVVLALWASRRLSDIGLITLPAILLSAFQIDSLIKSAEEKSRQVITAFTVHLSLVIFAYLNFLWIIRNATSAADDATMHMIAAIAAIVMIFAVTLLEGWGWSWRIAKAGLLLTLTISLGLHAVFQTSRVIRQAESDENNLLIRTVVIGESLLEKSIDQIAFMNGKDKRAVDIAVEGSIPDSLRWALRDRFVTFYPSGIPPMNAPSIIISLEEKTPQLADEYRGQRMIWSRTSDTDFADLSGWLSWALLRNSTGNKTHLFFWVRSDLLPDSY